MNILVLDFWFGKTHQRLNKKTIEILAKKYNVLATTFEDYYEEFANNDKVQLIDVKCKNKKTNKFFQRIQSVYNIVETKRAVKNKSYDAILITGYEVISVVVASWLFGTKRPIFLQYHQHIDQIACGLKKLIFDMYKTRVHHIFLEEEYAEYFTNIACVGEERVHVVHHPILGENAEYNMENKNLILGISSSNDEAIVEKIIESEKSEQQLKRSGYRMELRSARNRYISDSLHVNGDFLSAEEYKEKFNEAETILVIPKKEEFVHRVSGTIYDAISSGKKVLGVDISIMRIMKSIAPSMFYIIDDNAEVLEKIGGMNASPIIKAELEKVRNRHSDVSLENEYENCFRKIDKVGNGK